MEKHAMTFHKFGFTDAKDFVLAQLFEGWEPTEEFYELIGEYCSEIDPYLIEEWIAEWHEVNTAD